MRTALQWIGRWRPDTGDAVLYGLSAVFAAVTAGLSGLALYRQWGQLAVGPYVAATLAATGIVLWRRRTERAGRTPAARTLRTARVVVFLFVLGGATLAPLCLEVAWRSEGNHANHVQPEAPVIEQAGAHLAHGHNPYRLPERHGHVVADEPGQPVSESYFPYLPFMTVFGLPSSTKAPIEFTDARIFFTVVTFVVVAGALALYRGPPNRRARALQVLTVLPTAALPLATGGDDMPVVAFLLLALVLAQRRRPGWSGFVFGVVSAMKFTAWPLALLALFAAKTPDGRRAPGRMALGAAVVFVPVVVPFLLLNAHDFVENVVLFPLGLAQVASPAASALPGHLIVTAFPKLHRVLPAVVVVVGGAFLLRHLVRRPPSTPAQVCALGGWVMTVLILAAPATRVGYLLYPINFFVWSYLFAGADQAERAERPLVTASAAA